MKFGRIDLTKTTYNITLDALLLNPVPVDEINRVYKQYCLYKNFKSVMPMIPGRFTIPNTEVFGYYMQDKLIAWSMYRIWDNENIVIDHHAWDYNNPKLRIGLRSLEKMGEKLVEILDANFTKEIPLPKLNKTTLPTLNKAEDDK